MRPRRSMALLAIVGALSLAAAQPPGTFRVMIGASSKDIRVRGELGVR